MKNNKKKCKITIGDELKGIENIGRLHDGENTFMAETIVFTGFDDSGAAGALSCLTIKDIEGRKFTVALPNGFVEKLTQNGLHHIFNKQPVEKRKKTWKNSKRIFGFILIMRQLTSSSKKSITAATFRFASSPVIYLSEI